MSGPGLSRPGEGPACKIKGLGQKKLRNQGPRAGPNFVVQALDWVFQANFQTEPDWAQVGPAPVHSPSPVTMTLEENAPATADQVSFVGI